MGEVDTQDKKVKDKGVVCPKTEESLQIWPAFHLILQDKEMV